MMRRAAALLSALMLLATACSSSNGGDPEQTSTTTQASTPTTAEATTTTAATTTTTEAPEAEEADDSGDEVIDTALAEVNLATAAFQDVASAEAAGYEAFLECFENPGVGGMGQHYVNMALLDDTADAAAPEAMVYETTPDGLELVAVEYIVPGDFVDPAAPPELLGQTFHLNEVLGVWVLHAWVWKDNPAGVFQDWNPKVRMCS